MLYTASYLEPDCHHGQLISISRSTPRGFHIDAELPLFAPSAKLLQLWKTKKINEEGYRQIYREEIRAKWALVKGWVADVDKDVTATLLCWERTGEFCHRNFVAAIIESQRPEIFGGRDVKRSIYERCKQCDRELIPGLDASLCLNCRIYFEDPKIMKQYREEWKKKGYDRESDELQSDNATLPLPGL